MSFAMNSEVLNHVRFNHNFWATLSMHISKFKFLHMYSSCGGSIGIEWGEVKWRGRHKLFTYTWLIIFVMNSKLLHHILWACFIHVHFNLDFVTRVDLNMLFTFVGVGDIGGGIGIGRWEIMSSGDKLLICTWVGVANNKSLQARNMSYFLIHSRSQIEWYFLICTQMVPKNIW